MATKELPLPRRPCAGETKALGTANRTRWRPSAATGTAAHASPVRRGTEAPRSQSCGRAPPGVAYPAAAGVGVRDGLATCEITVG